MIIDFRISEMLAAVRRGNLLWEANIEKALSGSSRKVGSNYSIKSVGNFQQFCSNCDSFVTFNLIKMKCDMDRYPRIVIISALSSDIWSI